MKRFLLPVLVLAACSATWCVRAADKPNVIVILTDDLGYGDAGCYGALPKHVRTPNIDRLASEGVKFTQFYTAGPVCSPTRASIMSGQYQARFGLTAHIHGHWKPFEKLAEPPIDCVPKNCTL